jgi:hypothetical protein
MSAPVIESGAAKNVTATGDVTTGPCQMIGFYVNSTTSGTVVINDGSTALSGTITPAIGFHRFPAICGSKLNVTIANTLNVTFFVSSAN